MRLKLDENLGNRARRPNQRPALIDGRFEGSKKKQSAPHLGFRRTGKGDPRRIQVGNQRRHPPGLLEYGGQLIRMPK